MIVVIRFTRNTSVVSRFIRWFSWGNWSHVEVEVPGGTLGSQWPDGVKVRPLEATGGGEAIGRRAFDLTPEQSAAFFGFLTAQIGKGYDYTSLFGFLIRRDWRSPKRWFCSELIQAASEQAGRQLLDAEAVNRVSPAMLALSPLPVSIPS